MFYQSQPGSPVDLLANTSYLFSSPPVLDPGFPVFNVVEDSGSLVIGDTTAVPTLNPGEYIGNIIVPQLEIPEDFTNLLVQWTFQVSAVPHRLTQLLQVRPRADEVELRTEIIALQNELNSVSLDIDRLMITGTDSATVEIFASNTPVGVPVASSTFIPHGESTNIIFDLSLLQNFLIPSLSEYNCLIQGTADSVPFRRYTTLFVLTPSIMAAMNYLEQFLHKSKIRREVIELQYSEVDLLMFLNRGLQMFNGYPPILTGFTGTNMQGAIRNGWLSCSTYYALGAQLLAENDLAFNFSGQSVTLDVDRTPALESALGRVESALDREVRPLKQLLGKAGIIQGDGSQQTVSSGRAMGITTVADHPYLNTYTLAGYPGRHSSWRLLRR